MRFFVLTALIGAILSGALVIQSHAGSGAWRPMTFHDLETPSADDPLQTLVWPDVIREANAYVTTQLKRPLKGQNARITALSSTFHQGPTIIIVSIISARGCDNGANDKGADIEASTCPLRIVTIEGSKVVSVKTETGCYVDHADPDLPTKNRSDDSYTRFDAASGTITLRTIVGGRDVSQCARTYSLK